jgi:CheY-like chemotaxis protein
MRQSFESRRTRGPASLNTIVVAGDPDDDARLILASGLTYAGYRLRLAGTGDELLREARADDVGLVIAEVDLPCADGLCAIEVLKRTPELWHLPVLAYCASTRVVGEARALSSGADRFIGDPAHLSDLLDVVASMHVRTLLGGVDLSDLVRDAVRPADVDRDWTRATTPLNSEGDMLSYGNARNSLVGELLKDAMAHEAGHYDEIGRRFDGIEREFPRGAAPQLTRLRVALAFWDGWIDARNREWPTGGNIDKGEWPMLARRIASDLAHDYDIADARVGARFDACAGSSTEERVQTLAARLRVE